MSDAERMYSNTRRSTLDGELALITRQARRELSSKPSGFRVSLPRLRSFLTRLTAALAVSAEPHETVWPQLRDYPYGTAA